MKSKAMEVEEAAPDKAQAREVRVPGTEQEGEAAVQEGVASGLGKEQAALVQAQAMLRKAPVGQAMPRKEAEAPAPRGRSLEAGSSHCLQKICSQEWLPKKLPTASSA